MCITPWYPKFNGSHSGLPLSSIHKIWIGWQNGVNDGVCTHAPFPSIHCYYIQQHVQGVLTWPCCYFLTAFMPCRDLVNAGSSGFQLRRHCTVQVRLENSIVTTTITQSIDTSFGRAFVIEVKRVKDKPSKDKNHLILRELNGHTSVLSLPHDGRQLPCSALFFCSTFYF